MSLCDDFWFFLSKLKERLIIITEYNLTNRIEVSERDERILYDLFKIHEDNDLLDYLKRDDRFARDVGNRDDTLAEEE